MKLKLLSSLGAVLLPFTLTSCSLFGIPTMNDLKRAEQSSFQRGQQAGRAAHVRAAYHQAQLEQERPAPPVPTRYYEVQFMTHGWVEELDADPSQTHQKVAALLTVASGGEKQLGIWDVLRSKDNHS